MTTWPDTLPQQLLMDGYAETPPSNVIRSTMDQGPPKDRRRSTDAERLFSGTMELTQDQIGIWEDFYYNTIDEVLPFDFPHPRTGATISVKVRNNGSGAPPYSCLTRDLYLLTLVLAEQP